MKSIIIGHIYPKQMNVYGDMGNIITLKYRLQQRGIEVNYIQLNSLNDFPLNKIDILVGGGGQDSNQGLVQTDLLKHANLLKKVCEEGLVCLMICGMYQLFGNKFVLPDNTEIKGAGILDIETIAGEDRLIGNILISSAYGKLIGFENHSGRTYLSSKVKPLGSVISGAGNNGEDSTEGAVYKNVFGTYMHGPALAKNPKFADEIVSRALARKYGEVKLTPLDDSLEHIAASVASRRPR